jgi:hypothetical protein
VGRSTRFQTGVVSPASFYTTISAALCWSVAAIRFTSPRLLELCAHYFFPARPCQIRAGNQTGRVERAIR